MAYDEALAGRLRDVLHTEPGLSERQMFGGLAFLLDGNMAVGASHVGGLILRVEHERTADLLAEPGAEPFEMRGRVMDGWLRVRPDAVTTDADLRRWAAVGIRAARALPPKT